MGSGEGSLLSFLHAHLETAGTGLLGKDPTVGIGKECFETDSVSHGFQAEWPQLLRWRGDWEVWAVCVMTSPVWPRDPF